MLFFSSAWRNFGRWLLREILDDFVVIHRLLYRDDSDGGQRHTAAQWRFGGSRKDSTNKSLPYLRRQPMKKAYTH